MTVAMPLAAETAEIQIGTRVLASRYFLAPLAGYTHLAFRRALRELGGIGLATTDLVHARLLLERKRGSLELIATHPEDRPLSVQLFGNDPVQIGDAAQLLAEQGYEGIDINMGCPMSKICGGAKLACEIEPACRLVEHVVNAVRLPVTVKMRLGWTRDAITAPQLAAEFEQVGVAAITIHGRTRQQGFRGRVDHAGIRAVVAAVQHIPIIGNGDVRSVEDALRMRADTGCQAVAIGRGAMLDPWLFARLKRHSGGLDSNFEPTADEQVDFLRRHFSLMTEQHAERACFMFRKFAGWYGARLGIPEDLEARLRQFESRDEFFEICDAIRARHGERQSTMATALIKVPNGPVEHW